MGTRTWSGGRAEAHVLAPRARPGQEDLERELRVWRFPVIAGQPLQMRERGLSRWVSVNHLLCVPGARGWHHPFRACVPATRLVTSLALCLLSCCFFLLYA